MKQKTGRKLLSFLLTLAMIVGLLPGMGMTAYAAGGGTEVTQANVICQQYSYMDAGNYSGGYYDTPPVEITNITLADAQAFGAAVNCPTTYWVVVYAKDGDNLKWTSNGKTGEQTSTPFRTYSAWCELYNDDVFHFGGDYSPNRDVTFYFSKGLAAASHTHSFTSYTADGATITATCTADGCSDPAASATLTIVAPTLTTYGETDKSAAATLTGLDAFNTATGKTIAATNIEYVGRDGTTYTESGTAPTAAGKYTAKITVEGQTASVNYEIAKATQTAVPSGITVHDIASDTVWLTGAAGEEYIIAPKGTTTPDWIAAVTVDEYNLVTFNDLDEATEYTVFARVAETDNYLPGTAVTKDVTTYLSSYGCGGEPLVGGTVSAPVDAEVDQVGISYQWYLDGTAIDGATGASYVVQEDDAGETLSVQPFRNGAPLWAEAYEVGEVHYATVNFYQEYKENEGELKLIQSVGNLKYGDTVEAPTQPTKSGYNFAGWQVGWPDAFEAVAFPMTVEYSTDVYAKWTANTPSYTPSSSSSGGDYSAPSSTTTTTTTTDTTSNPDASTTNGTATVTTTTNRDGSTTEKTTETATKSGGDGSKTEVKAEATTTTKSNTDGTTTAATTAATTATTTAADGSKTVTETKTEAKETLDKSGNGTVEAKTTETVKDESGRVTATTVTESKGTVSTATDGTKTTTTTNTAVTTDAAGNKTTVVTTEKATVTTDGNTGKVVSDESGKVVSVEAKVSETAVESAAKSGETVTLPVTVTAAQSAEDATPVAITVPKTAESVKVEIPVEDVKPGTVAVIVHEDGTEEIVKTSTTSKDGVVLALESGASVKVVDNTRTFNDVSGSEWYADNVTWAASREVMNGVSNNAFAPNEVTTTGMVAQILMNLSGETANPNTAAEKYSDIKANDWFAAPISWLTEAGIAQGEGDAFGATEAITRERDIVLLHNYAQHMGYDTSARADLNRFADAGSVSDWARDAMAWAVGAGIINGTTDGSRNVVLDPQGSATRAQVTAMTERFCKKTAR